MALLTNQIHVFMDSMTGMASWTFFSSLLGKERRDIRSLGHQKKGIVCMLLKERWIIKNCSLFRRCSELLHYRDMCLLDILQFTEQERDT